MNIGEFESQFVMLHGACVFAVFPAAGGAAFGPRPAGWVHGLFASLAFFICCVAHPASMTHGHLTADQRAAAGISLTTIQVSAGLEDPADLIADLDRALAL